MADITNQQPTQSSERRWDLRFLKLAKEVGTWSKDPSTKVGAVIATFDHEIVSVGFNGFPRMMEDSKERLSNRDEKYSRIVHAEMNAILFAGPGPIVNRILYTYPLLPCDRCAVMIGQTQIYRVVSMLPTKELEARWGSALERSRSYFQEMDIDIVEYDLQDLEVTND